MLAIGIMSGTSLDGIDIALAEISGINESTDIKFIYGKTYQYSNETLNRIKDVMDINKSNIVNITSLNYELGNIYGNLVLKFCKEFKININDISFIASHGQTVWHQPNDIDTTFKSTLQLGEGAIISYLTKTNVISNFRAADIAAGGQGAPLVPFVDKLIFKSKNKNIAIHNLGGISNTTLLSKNDENVIAFDTGPANMMIDYSVQYFYNKKYDENGNIAKKGKLIKDLFDEVLGLDFFKIEPPKSTGRELFGDLYTSELISKYNGFAKEDYVHTFTMITAHSIINSYKKIEGIDEIIFSGGGAHNNYLISYIEEKLPNIKISLSSYYNIDIDFKEALAFIVLGNQTINFETSNLKSATGANEEVILGQINYYKKNNN